MRRMDLVFDPSLVLYLPLYERDGGSFVSREAYGQVSTNYGSLWTPRGRSFDGVDDRIDVAYHPAYDEVTQFTVQAWVGNIGQGAAIVSRDKYTGGGAARLWKVHSWAGGSTRLAFEVFGLTDPNVEAQTVYHGEGFYFVSCVFKNSEIFRISVDGQMHESIVPSGPVVTSSNFGITLGDRNDPGYEPYQGIIGEVWFYSRALSPIEEQHNYLATKGRYQ